MSDTGTSPVVETLSDPPVAPIEAPVAVVAVPAPAPLYVPANLPLPARMENKGDMYSNWKYLKMQWEDYNHIFICRLPQRVVAFQFDINKVFYIDPLIKWAQVFARMG